MWILPYTKQEMAEQMKKTLEEFNRKHNENIEKQNAKERWIEYHTCPHCGYCPPFPPETYHYE